MRITDRNGQDVLSAQVGDPLALRFEIADIHSPYEIFVRELVAMDGVDSSEILLIDSQGCPTDTAIMGALVKVNGTGQVLHAPFDAFKFPTSEVVQFKALVTPCLPSCEPARCTVRSFDGVRRDLPSHGRRRRSDPHELYSRPRRATDPEELVVVHAIHISDKFGFGRTERKLWDSDDGSVLVTSNSGVNDGETTGSCMNIVGLIIACSLFLVAQLVILLTWACLWQRRRKSKLQDIASRSADMLYSNISKPNY